MKKLLVLFLVLGVASLATAGLVVIGPATAVEGTTFDVIVSGLAADAPYNGGLYEPTLSDASKAPVNLIALAAAGNLAGDGGVLPSYGGFDFIADDLLGAGVEDGDWYIATYVAGPAGGSLVLDLYDYAVDYYAPVSAAIATIEFVAVPEPATMAILGLGALVLRRKK